MGWTPPPDGPWGVAGWPSGGGGGGGGAGGGRGGGGGGAGGWRQRRTCRMVLLLGRLPPLGGCTELAAGMVRGVALCLMSDWEGEVARLAGPTEVHLVGAANLFGRMQYGAAVTTSVVYCFSRGLHGFAVPNTFTVTVIVLAWP
jgi:hypothetical protein